MIEKQKNQNSSNSSAKAVSAVSAFSRFRQSGAFQAPLSQWQLWRNELKQNLRSVSETLGQDTEDNLTQLIISSELEDYVYELLSKDETLTESVGLITNEDLELSKKLAEAAVNDFVINRKRHTNALKAVFDYLTKLLALILSDSENLENNSGRALAELNIILSKLEDWEKTPVWVQDLEFEKAKLSDSVKERFNLWYSSIEKRFQAPDSSLFPKSFSLRCLVAVRAHLCKRVSVESVKNWLRAVPSLDVAVADISKRGFEIISSGITPDGKVIPSGSDMIIFVRRILPTRNMNEPCVQILPFARDGHHMQRFDDVNILEGMRKDSLMKSFGPDVFSDEELFGFRLDHNPSRLIGSEEQVGFAILRPGPYGKNILYMEFKHGFDMTLIPKGLRADPVVETSFEPDQVISEKISGTNTGVLYSMLRNKK